MQPWGRRILATAMACQTLPFVICQPLPGESWSQKQASQPATKSARKQRSSQAQGPSSDGIGIACTCPLRSQARPVMSLLSCEPFTLQTAMFPAV